MIMIMILIIIIIVNHIHLVTLSPNPAQTPTPNSSNLTITASADISHSHIFENCKISPRARYARIGCFYSRSSNLTIIAPSTIPHAMVKRFMHLYDEWNNNATYKVDRCLARYSPRATTTNRPTNRAPNEPARPGQKWTKMPISGQIWSFLGKKS